MSIQEQLVLRSGDGQWNAAIRNGYYPYPPETAIVEPPIERKIRTINGVWERFRTTHSEIADPEILRTLSMERVAELGNELIVQTGEALNLPEDVLPRAIDPSLINEQLTFIRDGGVELKRHGGQVNSTGDKITMMQDPANGENPATDISLAEAVGDALVLLYIRADSGREIALQTSPDARALDVARVFSVILGIDADVNLSLKCMRYRDDLTQVELHEILTEYGASLGINPHSGNVPWIKPIIERVAEPGTFQRRREAIRELVGSLVGNGKINVLISHSQEHQETADNPYLRLSELGNVIIVNEQPKPFVMQNGIFGSR